VLGRLRTAQRFVPACAGLYRRGPFWGARELQFSWVPSVQRLDPSLASNVKFCVAIGPVPVFVSLSSASRPLLRSGRGLGGLPFVADARRHGRAAPSLCCACPAAPPWAAAGALLLCLRVLRRGTQVAQGRNTLYTVL